MQEETRPLPALANSAFALMRAAFTRDLQTLGQQTLDAMGLTVSEWGVDFDRGVVVRHAQPVEVTEPDANGGAPQRFAQV